MERVLSPLTYPAVDIIATPALLVVQNLAIYRFPSDPNIFVKDLRWNVSSCTLMSETRLKVNPLPRVLRMFGVRVHAYIVRLGTCLPAAFLRTLMLSVTEKRNGITEQP